ncbi:hypothetical protein FBR05_08645 [Deltaproteobacteria bacterium PRO3]|nr:hypothetical protein [Deltaproteobacteria bacterium PRO3]
MSKPVCSANSAVESDKLSKIQEMAERAFTEAKPVQDKEILSEKELKAREAAVCKAVGGDCLRLHHYAERVANALIPPTGLQVRTEANIVRLFASKRISAKEIAGIVKLAEDRDRITAFREAAQAMFLKAGLFYYDHVPYQGAVMCFMPKK